MGQVQIDVTVRLDPGEVADPEAIAQAVREALTRSGSASPPLRPSVSVTVSFEDAYPREKETWAAKLASEKPLGVVGGVGA